MTDTQKEDKKYHFISGLPRSGTTLLSAILYQNPRFQAGMSSPVSGITSGLTTMMSQSPEINVMVDDAARLRLVRSVFTGYYEDCDRPVIFDTSRGWTARIPELLALFDDIKIVAMVRDPAWILDSLEKITRLNPMRQTGMYKPGMNLDARVEQYMASTGMVGAPLGALRECLFGPDSHRVLLVEYDALCSDPEKTVGAIYTFLGEPSFQHDFSNVEYAQDEFDTMLRTPGLHTVSGPVLHRKRKTILPPTIFEKSSAQAFWTEDISTKAGRILLGRA